MSEDSPLPPSSPMSFQPLNPADARAFDGLLEIYREAIPLAGQKAPAALAAMLHRPDYRFVIARDAGGIVAGFAALFAPPGEDVALLEYLAVEARLRGSGIGGALFHAAGDVIRADAVARAILVEVDSADPAGPDRDLRLRRQAFYRRHGCRRVEGLSYLLPLPGPPPPMDLFIDSPPPRIAKALLRRWLTAIYRDVYGQPADDPRIERMLATVDDPVGLD